MCKLQSVCGAVVRAMLFVVDFYAISFAHDGSRQSHIDAHSRGSFLSLFALLWVLSCEQDNNDWANISANGRRCLHTTSTSSDLICALWLLSSNGQMREIVGAAVDNFHKSQHSVPHRNKIDWNILICSQHPSIMPAAVAAARRNFAIPLILLLSDSIRAHYVWDNIKFACVCVRAARNK